MATFPLGKWPFLQSWLDIYCKVNYTKNAKQALQGVHAYENQPSRFAQSAQNKPGRAGPGRGRHTADHHPIEVGKYTASLPLAHKIAVYFGLSIEEVFLFEEE